MKERIRIGVVGTGAIGRHHARILHHLPDVHLAGVCDTNFWRAQIVAWRCRTTPFRDYHELLKTVDALVIAVPTQKHLEVGTAAFQQGVHCLIEKPLASSLEEAKSLLALSEEKKRVLQVGHVERFNPAVLEAIHHIRHPRFITVERLGPYDPRVSHIGVVLDLMIHDLDILLTLVGSDIESLEAIGASLLSDHEDIANVRMRFTSGCVADLTASRISLERSRRIRIFQQESYLSLDYMHPSLKIYRRKSPVIRSLKDIEALHPKLEKTEPLKLELLHFLDCIRHSRKPWISGEHGIEALRLAFRITEELKRHELSGSRNAPGSPKWATADLREITKTLLGR